MKIRLKSVLVWFCVVTVCCCADPIEKGLEVIRAAQLPDGAFRMSGSGVPVRIVPYFSNFAAMALLAANEQQPNPEDVQCVRRWIDWYVDHQESDGTIFDYAGTVDSYRSKGTRDSTDSYAATFLMVLRRYQKVAEGRVSAEYFIGGERALHALEDVMQPDGLTVTKPEYRIKYLMDNIEVYQGLVEGADLFDSVGRADVARRARSLARGVADRVSVFWQEEESCFAYALDMNGKLSSGFSDPYPHGLAQLFALAHCVPAPDGLWARVKETFEPDHDGVPVERWLLAANRCGDPESTAMYRRQTESALAGFSSENIQIHRPAIAILALLGESVRFPDMPLFRMPPSARVAFEEDWSTGAIDPDKWYVLRKMWGNGNHGVVPENVFVASDNVNGVKKNVLVCRGHGDLYDGSVVGWNGNKNRVGGVIVSKPYFASGRFDVVMKIGGREQVLGGPLDPARPIGMLPAIWTYAYRWVYSKAESAGDFDARNPLYNPYLEIPGQRGIMYWSELDFPEFGKNQNHSIGLYNTFLNLNHQSRQFSTARVIDGDYHTFTTIWRTELISLSDIKDEQVEELDGYWWVQDRSVPFVSYRGNPLRRLGRDRYALYQGREVLHFIDGEYVGTNREFVPAMAAQLNIGVWFPVWAGAAPWKESSISIASVRVWQFDDPGDIRNVLVDDIGDNMDLLGVPR